MKTSPNMDIATRLIKRCENCGRFPEVRVTYTAYDNIGIGSDKNVQSLKTSTKWNVSICCRNCKTAPIAFDTNSCKDLDDLFESACEEWNHAYGANDVVIQQTASLLYKIKELRTKSPDCQVAIMDSRQDKPKLLLSGTADTIDTILSKLPEMKRIGDTRRYTYDEPGYWTQGVPSDIHRFYVFEPLIPCQLPYDDWGIPTDDKLKEDE